MSIAKVELLAPAGKWDVLEAVVSAGADAVYLGGKRFNMRMLRPEYNFSDQELGNALDYLRERGKKLYVTVNNLYLNHEITQLEEHLFFLQDLGIDALIVQDLGLVGMYHRLGLKIPLHASVQMGVASAAGARFFESMGFSRVVFSKNLTIAEINAIKEKSNMEIEFFAHGDLCVSHTGQCFMSSFMRGEGGNRGRCLKPCRWIYRLLSEENSELVYRLAYKDLYTLDLVDELVKAGVISLKIEGRMREAPYLVNLVGAYRRALDAILQGDMIPELEADKNSLHEKRLRDFTSGNLKGQSEPDAIGISGEREFFISHAFVLPRMEQIPPALPMMKACAKLDPAFTVKAGDLQGVEAACRFGVQRIILPGEEFRQSSFTWSPEEREEAIKIARAYKTGIYFETPRIVSESDFGLVSRFLNKWGEQVNGMVINDWGTLHEALARGCEVIGGYGLNVFNRESVSYLIKRGLMGVTASLELGVEDLVDLLAGGQEISVLMQGPLCGMISDVCLACSAGQADKSGCQSQCLHQDYMLEDACGQRYRIVTDSDCRNYIYYPYELAGISYLPRLLLAGLKHLRIDGQFYSSRVLNLVLQLYSQAVDDYKKGTWDGEYYNREIGRLVGTDIMVPPNQVQLS